MRFTHSLFSFKSGRISPKLLNRVDTQQYRDGLSELKGMRVMPEGGVERFFGIQHVQDSLAGTYANLFFGETKLFSFNIDGTSLVCMLVSKTSSSNEVGLYVHKYPYTHGTHQYQQIIQAGPNPYDVHGFDWTISDNTLVLVHTSGTMQPMYIKFDNSGNIGAVSIFESAMPHNLNYGTSAIFPFFTDQLPDIIGKWPLSDIRQITGGSDANFFDVLAGPTTDTIIFGQVFMSNFHRDNILKSKVVYVEGIGRRDFGDGIPRSYIGSDFFFEIRQALVGELPLILQPHVTKYFVARFLYKYYVDQCIFRIGLPDTQRVTKVKYPMFFTDNWPRSVTSHEGRVVFGGTPENPLSLFGSSVGAIAKYNNERNYVDSGLDLIPTYYTPTNATDPFLFNIRTKEDSRIHIIRSAVQSLTIVTDRKEYVATGGDTILSSLSVSVKPQTATGTTNNRSADNGKSVFFLPRNRTKLVSFKYTAANGSFISQELSLLFSDLLEGDTIKQVEWCPHINTLLVVTDSSALYGITIDEESETLAVYDTGLFGVDSAAFVSSQSGVGNHVVLFQRHLSFNRSLKIFAQTHMFGHSKGMVDVSGVTADKNQYLYYSDTSMIQRIAPNIFSWNGMIINTGAATPNVIIPYERYPEGSTVYITDMGVNADIKKTYEVIVGPDNDIALYATPDLDVSEVYLIGRAPTSASMKTLPIEAGQQWGTAQMGVKNIDTIGVRVYKTYSLDISADGENWQEAVAASKIGHPQTTRVDRKFSASPKEDQAIYLRNTKPEPLTVLGINIRGVSNDG